MTPKYRSSAASRRCFGLILGLLAPAFVFGQAAPAPTPAQTAAPAAGTPAATETPLVLSPYEVKTDQDKGYAAGNTLSGSRVDTPLKITSSSISVMTREFLDDFAITDMNQAAAFAIGMEPPAGGSNDPFGGGRFQTSFRGGDSGANFPTRDGWLQYQVADTYNTERLEFSRGPSTALFGDSGPGGSQGSQSKRAIFNRQSRSITARVDSYEGYRGTFDVNAGYDRFAVRVNGLRQNVEYWLEAPGSVTNALSVATKFKITDKTELRTNFEHGSEDLTQIRRFYSDQQSLWDRATINEDNQIIANPGNYGIGQVSATDDRLIYNFATGKVYNYKGAQYQSVGLGYTIPWAGRSDLPNFSGFDKEFFLGPSDSKAARDNDVHAIYLDHQFTPNWALQIAHNAFNQDVQQQNLPGGSLPGDRRIDVNRLLPDGTPNPKVGKLFSDTGTPNLQYQQDTIREYRATTTYRFAVPQWFDMKQSFNLNAGWRKGTFESTSNEWRWSNNPLQPDLTNTNNTIRYRVYYDNPQPSVSPVLPPNLQGYTFRLIPSGTTAQAKRSRTISNAHLFSMTSFWDERISVSASIRRDKAVFNGIEGISILPANDYKTVIGTAGVAGARRIRTEWFTSKTAGLVAYPFADRFKYLAPLGFVLNYSSNFQQIPNSSATQLNGALLPVPQAETKDFGLRYSVEGKGYLTLTHYSTDRTGVGTAFGSAGNFRAIYTNLGYTQDLPNGVGPSTNAFNFQDPQDQKLEGWEAELTANPTRNLTLIANYSHPIVTTVKDSEARRAFLAANLAEFQAGAAAQPGQVINGRTIGDPLAIQSNLQAINDSLNGIATGTLQNGLERHRASLSARYSFTDGALKGLGINGAVTYRGYRKIGSRDARIKFQLPGTATPTPQQNAQAAFDYLWTDPTTIATMGVNYRRRFGNINARFQLNIENLFDNQDIRWTSYATINAGQLQRLPSNNNLTIANGNPRMQVLNAGVNDAQFDPRKFILSATFDF